MGMRSMTRRMTGLMLVAVALMLASLVGAAGASAKMPPVKTVWMPGFAAPATPERFDKVGIVKIGNPAAKNVLVIEPGTSGGGAYFIPFAEWVTSKAPGWQVWAVERRENLLETQSEANKFKQGKVTAAQFFRYYLGFLAEPDEEKHLRVLGERAAVRDGARGWGMSVAVQDLHIVIEAAKALGGKVALGGHSLGGTVVTAYATWDFGGKPGADGLSGLVFDDGGSSPSSISASTAEAELAKLNENTPWLAFGGIPAPYLGLFSVVGSDLAHLAGTEKSKVASFPLLPATLVPHNGKGEVVPTNNEAAFGYGVNVGTSPEALIAAQIHGGAGLTAPAIEGEPWTWDGTGAITPLQRYAEMLSAPKAQSADGVEWYFPERLTLDSGAVGNGLPNPAQSVMGLDSIHGTELPTSLHILAVNSELDKHFGGAFTTLTFAEELAEQSKIPSENVTLVNLESTYSHNDTNGAYPTNEFVSKLVPFLEGL